MKNWNSRNGLSEKAYLLGLISTFLVSPLVSLIFIIDGMRRNERSAYFVFALFLSLIAYMLAPISDLASYGFIYYIDKNLNWTQFALRFLKGEDFIMQTIEWLFAQIGIPFAFMRFLQTLVAFLILNSIFFYKIEHNKSCYTEKEVFYRYICYILVFPFILMVGGVRFGFGVVVMLYGFHLYIDRKKTLLCLIMLIIASWIHFSLLYYSLMSFAVLHFKISRKYMLISLVIIFVVSIPIQSYLEVYFLKNELQGVDYLGDGVWGRQTGMSLGTNAFVYHWGQRLFLLPLVFVFIKRYDYKNKWLLLWFSYMLFFACMYSAFALAQRTTVCLMSCSVFVYLSIESYGSKVSTAFNRIFLISALLSCSFDIYTHREQIVLSNYWRIAQPAVLTFTQDYDRTWLLEKAPERAR